MQHGEGEEEGASNSNTNNDNSIKSEANLEQPPFSASGPLYTPATLHLTDGLLLEVTQPVLSIDDKLNELHKTQLSVLEILLAENEKMGSLPDLGKIAQTMEKLPAYEQKLRVIKRDMSELVIRLERLKKRSNKLQEEKIKLELQSAKLEEREKAKDKQLIAKISLPPSLTKPNPTTTPTPLNTTSAATPTTTTTTTATPPSTDATESLTAKLTKMMSFF
eukprot:TRINITY_DN3584_c0_g1_i1.p1 TRINITY_DN3584_c0_g1~~TRINITY_DN3584_c0_g1_i1.p1  ORF type:complete len:220 (-),score=80.90 TRINITY_DN3584_c0_g1_i1:805-1464(-)